VIFNEVALNIFLKPLCDLCVHQQAHIRGVRYCAVYLSINSIYFNKLVI